LFCSQNFTKQDSKKIEKNKYYKLYFYKKYQKNKKKDMKHYDNILEFNEAFEVETHKGDNFFDDEALVKFRMALITEEVQELKDALAADNLPEIIDALSDILFVTYGALAAFNMGNRIEIDLDYKVLKQKYARLNISDIEDSYTFLVEAIEQQDKNAVGTHLENLIMYCYEALIHLGIHPAESFEIVHRSNMSKLCVSEEEAIATIKSYENDSRYDTPTYRESKSKGKWIIFNESTKKVLKSINYTAADFSSLLFK
jgi:predicted HAD superfamily Cof-like phosphohydrolase